MMQNPESLTVMMEPNEIKVTLEPKEIKAKKVTLAREVQKVIRETLENVDHRAKLDRHMMIQKSKQKSKNFKTL